MTNNDLLLDDILKALEMSDNAATSNKNTTIPSPPYTPYEPEKKEIVETAIFESSPETAQENFQTKTIQFNDISFSDFEADTPKETIIEDWVDTEQQNENGVSNKEEPLSPIDLEKTQYVSSTNLHLNSSVKKEDFIDFFTNQLPVEDIKKENTKLINRKNFMTFISQRLNNKSEETNDYIDLEHNENENEFLEYNTHQDEEDVFNFLKKNKTKALIKSIIFLVLFLVTAYLDLLTSFDFLPTKEFTNYIYIKTGILIVAMILDFSAIKNGCTSFFKNSNVDIFPTITIFTCLVQALLFTFIIPSKSNSLAMFTSIAILSLFLNSLGKVFNTNVMLNNFIAITKTNEYSVSYILKDKDLVRDLSRDLNQTEPQILISRKTSLIKNFLSNSYSKTIADTKSNKIATIILISAFILSIITLIFSNDILITITAFTATICLVSPLSIAFTGSLPNLLMFNASNKLGANIIGSDGMNEISNANILLVNSLDIFPRGSIKLSGIKTFEKERIDLAILYATSLIVEGSDTLKDIFLNIIEGNTSMLYNVDRIIKETGSGIIGWVDNNRVIVGNRSMMQKYDIDIPSIDYEKKYTKNEKQPIYLAVSGKLFAMFLIKYQVNPDVAEMINETAEHSISLLLSSDDFNLTSEFVENKFNLVKGSVKVISASELDMLKDNISYIPQSDGKMAHLGTFSSCCGGVYASIGAKNAIKSANIIQFCGIIFAIIIMLFLTFTKGILVLTFSTVLLFTCAWLLITCIIILLKRY